jgi:hypothetical protein
MVIVKKCTYCSKEYTAERSTSKFCGDACKRDSHRTSQPKKQKKDKQVDQCSGSIKGECPDNKVTDRKPNRIKPYRCRKCGTVDSRSNHLNRFLQSTIGLGVIQLITRAGTIETFRNISDLDSYVKMVKRRRAYESTDKQYDFHICHLSPLKGSETVGLTNAHNCIIGLAKLNQKMSNKEIYTEAVDGIHYIYRDSLQNKWEVGTKNESRIREMLVEYFGEGLSVWAKDVGFTPRDASGYKLPIRVREKTFLVMLEQLFGKAAKTLDGDERNSISLAWLNYQYQYLYCFDDELNDEYLGSEEELEAAGIAMQKYLLTGDSEHAGQVEGELKKLVEKDYMDGVSAF